MILNNYHVCNTSCIPVVEAFSGWCFLNECFLDEFNEREFEGSYDILEKACEGT